MDMCMHAHTQVDILVNLVSGVELLVRYLVLSVNSDALESFRVLLHTYIHTYTRINIHVRYLVLSVDSDALESFRMLGTSRRSLLS